MLSIVFKNLKSTDFIKEAVDAKIGHVVKSFPKFKLRHSVVIVEMVNSFDDLKTQYFNIKIISNYRHLGTYLTTKSHEQLNMALSSSADHHFKQLQKASEKLLLKTRKWGAVRKLKRAEHAGSFQFN